MTQERTDDRVLCPVRQAVAIVSRLRKVKTVDDDTLICPYVHTDKLHVISKQNLLQTFRSTATALGEDI